MKGQSLLISLTLIASAILCWQLRWVLLILFGAIVLSVALDVLTKSLQTKLPCSRPIALSIVIFLLILGGVMVFLQLAPELIKQIEELSNVIPIVVDKVGSIITSEPRLTDLSQSLPMQFSWERIQPVGTKLLGFAGGAANSLTQIALIMLLAVLLAIDPESHRKMIISITPRPARQQMLLLLDKCRLALGGWLTGMTISAMSVFFITWAGLSLMKVPLALLSSLICGLLTFVPTIGPTAASLLPLGVSLLISPSLMVQVLIFRLFVQNLEAFLLTPLLLKRTVNLLPTVSLTAQLSLGALLGVPGVLLALPLVIVIQVCMQQVVVNQIMDQW